MKPAALLVLLAIGCHDAGAVSGPGPGVEPPATEAPDTLDWYSRTGYAVFGGEPSRVGDAPFGVVAGDFNADGAVDLATANCLTNNVTVFLGEGGGRFDALSDQSFFPTRVAPKSITAVDFDVDGNLDLVTTGQAGGTSALWGKGDGTFATDHVPSSVQGACGPPGQAIATGDLNGDGIGDVVAANWYGHRIGIVLGPADASTVTQLSTPPWPNAVVLADFNGDHALDVAVAAGLLDAGFVSVFLGQGDGKFGPRVDLELGRGAPSSIAVADLDRDGAMDLAVVSHSRASVYVAWGNGDGTFTSTPALGVSGDPLAVAAADLDADGNLDLLVASELGGGCMLCAGPLTIHLGNGDRSFRGEFIVAVGAYATGVALADFNADGLIDFALSDAANDELVVFLRKK